MKNHKIGVHPMVYPSVPEDGARLRFFVTAAHTEEHLLRAADAVLEEWNRIKTEDATSEAAAMQAKA